MPVLKVEVAIDGATYPELYAVLVVCAAQEHAERLRALCAAGVIWESVRLSDAASGSSLVARALFRTLGRDAKPAEESSRAAVADLPTLTDEVRLPGSLASSKPATPSSEASPRDRKSVV